MLNRLNIEQLDDQQRVAVESEAAPLCILAGPGSGKTRVLAHRIARRVEDASADPRHVLALTFTRQAANQLKDVIAFTMLVLVLIFRPQGILGERLAEKKA